ncbi:hypothetical protein [Streptomyces sp. NPDC048516]|uniref:hypothetical protein n=1 Tax=Streptomyces sp. NPDC048516 TaxID=3365565 RepID=UPI00371D2C3F
MHRVEDRHPICRSADNAVKRHQGPHAAGPKPKSCAQLADFVPPYVAKAWGDLRIPRQTPSASATTTT